MLAVTIVGFDPVPWLENVPTLLIAPVANVTLAAPPLLVTAKLLLPVTPPVSVRLVELFELPIESRAVVPLLRTIGLAYEPILPPICQRAATELAAVSPSVTVLVLAIETKLPL